MARYREKVVPAIIEAEQWFPGANTDGVCGDNPNAICGCVLLGGDGSTPHVHTPGGSIYLSPGDWVITSVGGRQVCKPDVFEETYELV